jgi:hypothetical protein
MNLATFRATSKPTKRTPAAVIPVNGATYAKRGYDGPGGVSTPAYLAMCVDTSNLNIPESDAYVVVWDAADVPAAQDAAEKIS